MLMNNSYFKKLVAAPIKSRVSKFGGNESGKKNSLKLSQDLNLKNGLKPS